MVIFQYDELIDAVVRHGFGMVLCQSREFGISITKVAILNQEKIIPENWIWEVCYSN